MVKFTFSTKKKDKGELSFKQDIKENENLISIREIINSYFWPLEKIDAKTIVFKQKDNILDLNEPLIKIVDGKESVDCVVNDNINPRLLLVLNIKRNISENKFISIQLEDTQTISQLKQLILQVSRLSVISLYKNKERLLGGNLYENKIVDNDEIIAIIQEEGQLLIYPILEESEPFYINYSNDEKVDDIKHRIADNLRCEVDDFILFYKEDILDENKYIYECSIINKNAIKYCYFNKTSEFKPLGDKIAAGEYSVVYKAELVKTGVFITVKKYNWKAFSMNLESHKLLIRELICFNRLDSHPHIVRLKAFYKDNESFYIGMDYMAGGSLFTYLSEFWPIGEHLIAKWTKQILIGLDYLHSKRVIHFDLKTSNILLNENKDIKISGFSYSKYVMGANSSAMSTGVHNSKPPTYIYSAPERLNEENAGSKSDIWSLGVILIELVTGKRPYSDKNEIDAVLLISRERKINYELPKDLSKEIKDFIGQCLIGDPKNRPKAMTLLEDNFIKLYTTETAMESSN